MSELLEREMRVQEERVRPFSVSELEWKETIQKCSLFSIYRILNVFLSSLQLGIRISLSHEKEPLGTGEFLLFADGKLSMQHSKVHCNSVQWFETVQVCRSCSLCIIQRFVLKSAVNATKLQYLLAQYLFRIVFLHIFCLLKENTGVLWFGYYTSQHCNIHYIWDSLCTLN